MDLGARRLVAVDYRKNINKNLIERMSPPQMLSLSFLLLIILGTILLSLPMSSVTGERIPFVYALFTATSAVCVTGLTVLDTGKDFSTFGQVIILLLFQFGGLGIMLFSTAFLGVLGKRMGLRERVLVQQSSPGLSLSGVSGLARRIVVFALVCEFIGFVGLSIAWAGRLGWESLYHAGFHSVSAFCNAGFSLYPDSISQDVANPLVNVVIMGLVIAGSFGYFITTDLIQWIRTSKLRISLHSYVSIVTTFGLIIGGALLFLFFEIDNPKTLGALDWWGKSWASVFQSVVMRTAGLSSVSVSDLREETFLFVMVLMFIGGCSGSTAGGIKVGTFALLVLAVWSEVNGRRDVVVHNRRVEPDRIMQALALVGIAGTTVICTALSVHHLEQGTFRDILFETVSAMATVGLSAGITSKLSHPTLFLLCFVMFLGRVGPLTAVSSLLKEKRGGGEIRFPKGEINIG